MIGRTQGWAAGLRMAAMSLAHRADREEAARKLAGDTGTVAEYLLAEVLDTQPAGVRQLLLDTSVVDVLRPGLADRPRRSARRSGPQLPRARERVPRGAARWGRVLPVPRLVPAAAARSAGLRVTRALGGAAQGGGGLVRGSRPGR